MEYLLHIVLALGLQAAAESGLALAPGTPLPLFAVALCAVPYLLASAARRAGIRGRFRAAALLSRAVFFSAPVLHFVAVALLGWLDSVERLTGERPSLFGWPNGALLLSFVPFVVYALVSIDARARAQELDGLTLARVRRFHARMFASALAPILLYGVVAWLVGLDEGLRVRIEEVGLWGASFIAVLLVLFVVALPWILRNGWEVHPLEPGRLREELAALAARARFRCRDLYVWRTGNLMANAAVAGVLPGQRVVLFSDALLSVLSLREIAAVFAHEIGHVARHHVLVFLVWAVALFLAVDLSAGLLEGEWLDAALALALFAGWWALFGWMSRRFELEADLYSLELTADPDALASALEKVGSPHTRALSSWRHFSTERRVAFLAAAGADPAVGARLSRQVRRLAVAGLAAALVLLVFEARKLVRVYPEQSVAVELRLGEFAAARERAAHAAGLAPELVRMVQRTAELPAGVRGDAGELTAAALAAAEHGDVAAAQDWLALAALRGAVGLEPAGRALDALAAGRAPDDEDLETLDPQWAAALARCADAHPPARE